MSAPAELLRELTAAGIEVRRDGNDLRVRAPRGTVTPDLIDRLKAEKPQLLAALTPRPNRVVLRFRLHGDAGWATALGAPNDTAEMLVAALRQRHGDALELQGGGGT
jgi:hypothetical protein